MPVRTSYIRSELNQQWGKASKAFAAYLDLAGQEITKSSAITIAKAGEEFMKNEEWDWPRGERYDTSYLGKNIRGSKAYKSGFRGGDEMHPWYSGNLHDSVAVGVMQGTRIMSARYMSPGASSNQTYNGSVIFGASEAQDALQRAARTFAPGSSGRTLRAVLVIGVPYAEEVNSSPTLGWDNKENIHQGYADYMSHEFYTTILPVMDRISKIKLKMK